MRHALITTTIHVPLNLMSWAEQLAPDDLIIVAGDRKTPHNEVRELLADVESAYRVRTRYLSPGDDTQRYRTHSIVGYNSIQRRNLALLEVLTARADWDYVITVDDDNFPEDGWVTGVDEIFDLEKCQDQKRLAHTSGWFDVGQLCSPPVTHRGFPIEHRRWTGFNDRAVSDSVTQHGVFASLWLGDPDVDAAERLVRDPTVVDVEGSVTLDAGTWCPFNSQATAYRRELAPLMYMWPHVGRMDDIWSSLAARVVMDVLGWHVRYGHPLVRQDRNEHNVATDLEAELLGYRYTGRLAELLHGTSARLSPLMTPLDALRCVYADLANYGTFLPDRTLAGFSAWLDDLHRIGVE